MPFDGWIESVRTSDVDRYPTDFSPELWLTDEPTTVGLYQMNEGTGTTTSDLSGNGYDGTLSGATWVAETHCDAN